MLDVIFLLIGAGAGFGMCYLLLKARGESALSAAQEKGRLLETNIAELKNELRLLAENGETKLRQERSSIEQLKEALAASKSDNAGLHQKLLEQKSEMEELNSRFHKEFENLANRILDEKGKKFTELNESQIKGILDPLRDKIRDFEQRIHQTHIDQEKERSALKQQLLMMTDMHKRMSDETVRLTNALKGEVKTQGNWGELILEKILEKSGLRKGVEYSVQQSFTLEDGSRLQPDVVIHLPDGKNLIVDSKVSLTAYERFSSAEIKDEQEKFLRDHILSVRNHVKGLSGKSYQNLYNIGSPDFVLMFIPIEPAFSLAVGSDDGLYHDAFEKNIIIVSTSTLLATLRTIDNVWKQERQSKNVMDIARQSGELYDKFTAVLEDFIKVGTKMKEGKDAYDEAMKKLHTGRGNVISRFESLKVLGAKVSKNINPKVLERTEDLGNDELNP